MLMRKAIHLSFALFMLSFVARLENAQAQPMPGPDPQPPPPIEACGNGADLLDSFYAPLWGCDQAQIDDMWNRFGLSSDDWAPFGLSDPCNSNKPLGRLFNALQLMAHSSTRPSSC